MPGTEHDYSLFLIGVLIFVELMDFPRKRKEAKRSQANSGDFQDASKMTMRTIDPVEYVQNRASEVERLLSSVRESERSKNMLQSIPKHMRRRAGNHNTKRIPKGFRGRAESTPTPAKESSRKKKRESKSRIQEGFADRPGRKWLPTHIWHAKRAHMENIWGDRIVRQVIVATVLLTPIGNAPDSEIL